jgi:hypothetical protein
MVRYMMARDPQMRPILPLAGGSRAARPHVHHSLHSQHVVAQHHSSRIVFIVRGLSRDRAVARGVCPASRPTSGVSWRAPERRPPPLAQAFVISGSDTYLVLNLVW